MSSVSEPALFPYPEPGGEEFTAGHSGSDTSRERAEHERDTGTLAERARQAITYLDAMGQRGLTVVDLREVTGLHHGQASSVLSVLHKAGKIARLAERRDRCQVYVLPEYVRDRETVPYTPNRRNRVEQVKAAVRAVCTYENEHGQGMRMASIDMIEFALDYPDEALRRFGRG